MSANPASGSGGLANDVVTLAWGGDRVFLERVLEHVAHDLGLAMMEKVPGSQMARTFG